MRSSGLRLTARGSDAASLLSAKTSRWMLASSCSPDSSFTSRRACATLCSAAMASRADPSSEAR